jgi:hypothetical protein
MGFGPVLGYSKREGTINMKNSIYKVYNTISCSLATKKCTCDSIYTGIMYKWINAFNFKLPGP